MGRRKSHLRSATRSLWKSAAPRSIRRANRPSHALLIALARSSRWKNIERCSSNWTTRAKNGDRRRLIEIRFDSLLKDPVGRALLPVVPRENRRARVPVLRFSTPGNPTWVVVTTIHGLGQRPFWVSGILGPPRPASGEFGWQIGHDRTLVPRESRISWAIDRPLPKGSRTTCYLVGCVVQMSSSTAADHGGNGGEVNRVFAFPPQKNRRSFHVECPSHSSRTESRATTRDFYMHFVCRHRGFPRSAADVGLLLLAIRSKRHLFSQ